MTNLQTFSQLKLSSWVVRQCNAIGLKEPTPIQQHCIPQILAGNDCIGCAKTGSGKTLAFALPVLQKLSEDLYGIYALVLTPTRELAFQIADQFAVVGKAINLKLCIVTGGVDMVAQGMKLSQKPHIVIATPGRLSDHIKSCDTFSLKKIKFLILDEADRLLGGGFDEQIQTIFHALPKKRQNLLFSATITDTLEKVKEVANNEVFMWEQQAEVATVDELDQFYVLCPINVKDSYMVEVVRSYREKNEKGSIMIFTSTCKNCQLLSMTLNDVGFENVALHSMAPQKERIAALTRFKSNIVKILIATDVASRGLDIPAVEMVINHTIPNVPKDYIHRVGRTARAGRKGIAVSLVTPYDIKLLHSIEESIKTKLKEYTVDGTAVVKILTQVSVTKREAEIKLDEKDFYEKKRIYKRKNLIMEGKDPDEVEQQEEEERRQKKKKRRREMRKIKKKAKTDVTVV